MLNVFPLFSCFLLFPIKGSLQQSSNERSRKPGEPEKSFEIEFVLQQAQESPSCHQWDEKYVLTVAG